MKQQEWRALLAELLRGQRWDELMAALGEASSQEWGRPVEGRDLSGVDLRGAKLRALKLDHPAMAGADLSDSVLEDVSVYGARAERLIMSRALLRGVLDGHFEGACFREADLRQCALSGSFSSADFRGANLDGASFGMASCFDGADFSGAKLRGSDEPVCLGAQGEAVSFRNARFVGADLSRLDIKIARFDGADLTDAVLEGAMFPAGEENTVSSFVGARLRGARARGALFCGADMRDADLTGAELG